MVIEAGKIARKQVFWPYPLENSTRSINTGAAEEELRVLLRSEVSTRRAGGLRMPP
jgi:hypothetical protein